MTRFFAACAVLLWTMLSAERAHAEGASSSIPPSVAVVALGDAALPAFALARAVYATRLRPHSLTEAEARVLAGRDSDATDAAQSRLTELAQLRRGIVSFDAPSRAMLDSMAQRYGLTAVVVVQQEPVRATRDALDAKEAAPAQPSSSVDEPHPVESSDSPTGPASESKSNEAGAAAAQSPRAAWAQLYFPTNSSTPGYVDAARYDVSADSATAVAAALERRFVGTSSVASTAQGPAPVLATRPLKTPSRPVYASPWFWGAVCGAALLGGIFWVSTRDTTPDNVRVSVKLPQ